MSLQRVLFVSVVLFAAFAQAYPRRHIREITLTPHTACIEAIQPGDADSVVNQAMDCIYSNPGRQEVWGECRLEHKIVHAHMADQVIRKMSPPFHSEDLKVINNACSTYRFTCIW